MLRAFGIILFFFGISSLCQAAEIRIKLRNQSPDTVNQLIVTPKATTASSANLIAGGLKSGVTATYSYAAPAGACVFELKFVFASGKTSLRPDTDLCQSDVIIIE